MGEEGRRMPKMYTHAVGQWFRELFDGLKSKKNLEGVSLLPPPCGWLAKLPKKSSPPKNYWPVQAQVFRAVAFSISYFFSFSFSVGLGWGRGGMGGLFMKNVGKLYCTIQIHDKPVE